VAGTPGCRTRRPHYWRRRSSFRESRPHPSTPSTTKGSFHKKGAQGLLSETLGSMTRGVCIVEHSAHEAQLLPTNPSQAPLFVVAGTPFRLFLPAFVPCQCAFPFWRLPALNVRTLVSLCSISHAYIKKIVDISISGKIYNIYRLIFTKSRVS